MHVGEKLCSDEASPKVFAKSGGRAGQRGLECFEQNKITEWAWIWDRRGSSHARLRGAPVSIGTIGGKHWHICGRSAGLHILSSQSSNPPHPPPLPNMAGHTTSISTICLLRPLDVLQKQAHSKMNSCVTVVTASGLGGWAKETQPKERVV